MKKKIIYFINKKMLRTLREEQKRHKIAQPIFNYNNNPISKSYNELKYLSSLCYTNYNGAIITNNSNNTSNSQISPEIRDNNKNILKNNNRKLNFYFSPKKNFNFSNSPMDDSLRKIKKFTKNNSSKLFFKNGNANNNIKLNHSKSQQKLINENYYNKKNINNFKDLNFSLNKKSSLQSLIDFKENLTNLENDFLSKVKEKFEENEKTSNILNENIESLNNNLLRSGKELNLTKEKNVFVNNENMKMNYNFKRMKLENKNNDDDIKNIREEINLINQELSKLSQENVEYLNKIMDYCNEINDMKSQIKVLPDLIHRCEEDRKNLSRAILIIQKKSQEIKKENYKIDIARDYLGQDLETALEIYKAQNIA